MIPRILEPEVMDSADEAREYDEMDHGEVNRRFADDFEAAAAAAGLPADARLLDVGTGTALIPIEIAARRPHAQITALDLSEEMLKLGRRNVERAGLATRITLENRDARELARTAGGFDAVISNSIVHHIPQPRAVFQAMLEACRPGGLLFVRDLRRPESEEERQQLIALHAGNATARQRQLFADSLHAALTVDEVADLLESIGLNREFVRQSSDRHWTIGCQVPR